MYFVRRLSKLRIHEQILRLFYTPIVYSVLIYAIPCWFHSYDKEIKRKIANFSKKMSKTLTNGLVEITENICAERCKTLITKMIADETHSYHPLIRTLPYGQIGMLKCRTEQFLKFLRPSAIKLLNSE